jgi:hypothetical protein
MRALRAGAVAVAVSSAVAAAVVALPFTSDASAAHRHGVATQFRGPVLAAGLCGGQAAFRVTMRQDGDNVVGTVRLRHAGVRARWDYESEARTDFGDGSGVAGHGDGVARAEEHGHVVLRGLTPLGVRHEFLFHLRRADTGERCFVRVKA